LFKDPSLAIVMEKPAGPPPAIHVVQDWFEEFRSKAP
jgi:hypothetical protein